MARTRRSSSPNTVWWLAGPALLIAALFAWLSGQPAVSPDGRAVFYPLLVLYSSTATALATLLVLVAIFVVGLWLPLALARKRQALVTSVAVIMALAASGLACWGALPQTFTPYRHLDRASYNGQVYQLGLRAVAQTDDTHFYYVLCTCDASGLSCRCRDLVATTVEAVTAPPKLVVDAAANRFSVQVGATTVYEFTP